jgi:surface polysaccharide O-acyltransferase-like enzyme
VLGAVWYGVLFSKQWVALEHMTTEQMQGASPVVLYSVAFLLELLIAYSLAQLCIWRNANTPGRGASVGVLVWIGFIGPIAAMTYMFEMRPKALFAINEFYPLAGLVLMGAIIGGWTKKAV